MNYTDLQNLQDFARGSRINQFEDRVYGNRDYDYAVAGLAGMLAKDRSKGQHGSDIGKLPNHPTFSNQSVYSTPIYKGGVWSKVNGQDIYTPSADMVKSGNTKGLAEYFSKYEPEVKLNTPVPYLLNTTKE